jgi:hypothetical protein
MAGVEALMWIVKEGNLLSVWLELETTIRADSDFTYQNSIELLLPSLLLVEYATWV